LGVACALILFVMIAIGFTAVLLIRLTANERKLRFSRFGSFHGAEPSLRRWSPKRAVSPASLLARFEELLRSVIMQALGDPFTAANRGNAVLATQALRHNTDFVLG